jgi:hypothetical protein
MFPLSVPRFSVLICVILALIIVSANEKFDREGSGLLYWHFCLIFPLLQNVAKRAINSSPTRCTSNYNSGQHDDQGLGISSGKSPKTF